MKTLDQEKLIEAIKDEIKWLENEAKVSADLHWYEKAAKNEITKQGVERIWRLIRTGDFNAK